MTRILFVSLCLAASATAASAQALAVLHAFPGPGPQAGRAFIEGADGNFYGTSDGGALGSGTLYRMTPAGAVTVLYTFTGGADGGRPGTLMQASNGAFYGMTTRGGTYGFGTIFRYTPGGTLETLHAIQASGPFGAGRIAPLVERPDGNLYGIASSPAGIYSLFRMTPTGTVTILYTFPSGTNPTDGPLVPAADGQLYGSYCGVPGFDGGLFRVNAAGSVTTIPIPIFGICPRVLIAATDGNLYGPGYASSFGQGILKITLTGTATMLHHFTGSDGEDASSVVQGVDGNLYGTASSHGEHNGGTVFKLGLNGTFAVLHAFDPPIDGGAPLTLIQGHDGLLYGMSARSAFRISTSGTFAVLHTFPYSDEGIKPSALVRASDGNFYGTTETGGASNLGTVFRMTPGGTITVLHSFTGGLTSGGFPEASLIQGTDGSLYGVTHGISSSGTFPFTYPTAFRVTLAGVVTTLHVFNASDEGHYPRAPLVQGTDGNFYGTTYFGLALGLGTVFRMTPSGTTTVLHAFGGGADGGNPLGALVQAADGNFYGTTDNGGPANLGTVFSMTPAGVVTVLHAFTGGADGSHPHAGLTPTGDGNFYGTTQSGGAANKGTIFRITPTGTTTIVHAFAGGVGGESPEAPLVRASDGHFYGTTSSGGPLNKGTVFRMTAAGAVSVVRSFSGADGDHPYTALVDTADGNLYGTTSIGGFGYGVVFRLRVQPAVAGNYDTDRKADFAVYRPATGTWYVLQSANGYTTVIERSWGLAGDLPVPGDYDGDGQADIAVYRPSTGVWYILESGTGFATSVSYAWGRAGDTPVPGDYDGDGLTDVAVYRPATGVWFVWQSGQGQGTSRLISLGRGKDVPVPADYDGDGRIDAAVYRPATGVWTIRQSSTNYATATSVTLGAPGDVPVPADYDGDGKTDAAAYRPGAGVWSFIRSSAGGTPVTVQWGLAGDTPVPADFDGDGKADPAVYRPAAGSWYVLESSTDYATSTVRPWGLNADTPLQNVVIATATGLASSRAPVSAAANRMRDGDFDGDGRRDFTVFRPATGDWFALHSGTTYTTARAFAWGINGDLLAPGDYDGDGTSDVAVYRPGNGSWYILKSSGDFTSSVVVQWGLSGDTPVPADYDGDGRADLAVYRPSTGQWFIRWSSTDYATSSSYFWGLNGDVPVPGDYDGDGIADLAVYRPANGVWYILGSASGFTAPLSYQWGLASDVAVPGDYDGDGRSDLAVYRPASGAWYVLQSSAGFSTSAVIAWGLSGDTAVPADYDGDGVTDPAVFRPSTREWHVLLSSSNFGSALVKTWGQPGDIPAQR